MFFGLRPVIYVAPMVLGVLIMRTSHAAAVWEILGQLVQLPNRTVSAAILQGIWKPPF